MKSIIPFILIIICFGAYFLYISPLIDTIATLRTEKNSYGDTLMKAKEIGTLRDGLLASYNSLSPEAVASLSKMIPDHFDPVAFVTMINDMASKYGMIVTDAHVVDEIDSSDRGNVATQGPQKPYTTHKITFSMKGSYSQFIQFERDLETHIELNDITRIAISPITDNSGAKQSLGANTALQYDVETVAYSIN